MIKHELFNDQGRRWVYFGRDPDKGENLIDTNQYLITEGEHGLLPDPGGMEVFPAFVSVLSQEIPLNNIEAIFASHQDPDIVSSLSLWLDLCGDIDVHVSWTWSLFIPHFGGGKVMVSIPDEGGTLSLGGKSDLKLIPAHYVHSSGNFSLYDPVAKILFSGDIGAALLPEEEDGIFVEDFENHTQYMTAFHQRWMPSNRAKNHWVDTVSQLDINMMCPQHGSIFKGEDVQRFLRWFKKLEVGNAVP